jgi:hypothetical protein
MASYCYHKYDFLKFRIAESLYKVYPQSLTVKQISDATGVSTGNISRVLSHYHKNGFAYFRRMRIKGTKAFRYRLNKKGGRMYIRCLHCIRLGFDLNPNRETPVKMATYQGIKKLTYKTPEDFILKPEQLFPYVDLTLAGVKKGLTEEDLLLNSGLIRDIKEPEALEELFKEPIKTAEPARDYREAEKPVEPVQPVKHALLPSKTYPTKQGYNITSKEMAEVLKQGIEHIETELKTTTLDAKIKSLKDKLRNIHIWIKQHPDVEQYIMQITEPVSVEERDREIERREREQKAQNKVLIESALKAAKERLQVATYVHEVNALVSQISDLSETLRSYDW